MNKSLTRPPERFLPQQPSFIRPQQWPCYRSPVMARVTFAVLLGTLLLAGLGLTGRAGVKPTPAPELSGGTKWFNTPGGAPLTLAALRGKVVLVKIWTGG